MSIWVHWPCLTPSQVICQPLLLGCSPPSLYSGNVGAEDSVFLQLHFHLGAVLQQGELRGQCHNHFAFFSAKFVLTSVIIVFHCFSISEPSLQCSLAVSGYVGPQKYFLKNVKTLKKQTFTECKLRLLARPATLSWQEVGVQARRSPCLTGKSLSLQGLFPHLH